MPPNLCPLTNTSLRTNWTRACHHPGQLDDNPKLPGPRTLWDPITDPTLPKPYDNPGHVVVRSGEIGVQEADKACTTRFPIVMMPYYVIFVLMERVWVSYLWEARIRYSWYSMMLISMEKAWFSYRWKWYYFHVNGGGTTFLRRCFLLTPQSVHTSKCVGSDAKIVLMPVFSSKIDSTKVSAWNHTSEGSEANFFFIRTPTSVDSPVLGRRRTVVINLVVRNEGLFPI